MCSLNRRSQLMRKLVKCQSKHQRLVRTMRSFTTTWREPDHGEVATLILLRHGQSTWNATPTFTGWCDPPLSTRGISEARSSGSLLAERGYHNFSHVFTSDLRRARITTDLVLETLEQEDGAKATDVACRVKAVWQLNERHYGALQGIRKDDAGLWEKHGEEQILRWRREFDARPPPMGPDHEFYAPPPAPVTESLADCQERVMSYWRSAIAPTLVPGSTVLLVAHSNTIRALLCYLDSVPPERIPSVKVPNSVPCVFLLDPSDGLCPVSPALDTAAGTSRGQWLFSAENHERLRGNIGGSGSLAHSIFDAWDLNGDGKLELREIEIGLRKIMGGEDIAVAAIAAKILEQVGEEGSETLDVKDFEAKAVTACRKFMPQLLEDV